MDETEYVDASSPPPDLILRPARPDRSDGRAFARLLDEAQEGWYRLALGSTSEELLSSAFIEGNHELSFEFVTFAEVGATVIGGFSAYSGTSHRGFSSSPLDAAARGRVRYRMMQRATGRMLTFIDQVADEDFYIRALAVDHEHRGRGIGTHLLDAIARAAVDAGCHRLALDVAATNKGGQRLYRRYGMECESESPRFLGLPNTNVLRMVKDL